MPFRLSATPLLPLYICKTAEVSGKKKRRLADEGKDNTDANARGRRGRPSTREEACIAVKGKGCEDTCALAPSMDVRMHAQVNIIGKDRKQETLKKAATKGNQLQRKARSASNEPFPPLHSPMHRLLSSVAPSRLTRPPLWFCILVARHRYRPKSAHRLDTHAHIHTRRERETSPWDSTHKTSASLRPGEEGDREREGI